MTVTLLGATEIRRLAAELDVTPTKKLGQNFVVDANTVRKIVHAADVQPGERVAADGALAAAVVPAQADQDGVEQRTGVAGLGEPGEQPGEGLLGQLLGPRGIAGEQVGEPHRPGVLGSVERFDGGVRRRGVGRFDGHRLVASSGSLACGDRTHTLLDGWEGVSVAGRGRGAVPPARGEDPRPASA